MEEIFTTNYYTQGIWVILGLLPIVYIGLSILWNRKLVPYRRNRGTPTAYFGNTFKRITQFSLKEDPRTIAPKKAPKIAQKLLTLKTINWALIIATFALIGVGNINAWIPAVTLLVIIALQTTGPLKQRDRILSRMFAVASAGFRYGRGSELNPWGYVKIKKWENLTTPGETHITFPATWDASSIAARDGFEAHFNTTVTENNTWIYEWKTADGLVIARPVSHLPERATYPGSEKYPWHVIPLGTGANGEVTVDLAGNPHMLVCGTTGSGKSVLQRNIIFHCIQHNDSMRFLGVDVKRVELKPFAKYTQTVLGIGTNLEDGVEIVRYAKEVMESRYEEMEERGVNHFKDLLDSTGKPPYAILLMVDEAYMFMAPEGAKTDEGKMRDQLHGDASVMLGEIARLGRASGVHLVLATQRPDATVIRGELKANLDIRVAAGRLDATPSSMVLDSGAATQLPGHIKGRGIVRFGGHQEQFQGYFAEQDWIDEWLEANPGREPELFPAGGRVSASSSADDELEALAAGYDFDDGEIAATSGTDEITTVSESIPVEVDAVEAPAMPVEDTSTLVNESLTIEPSETLVEPVEGVIDPVTVVSAPPTTNIVEPNGVEVNLDDDSKNIEMLKALGLWDDISVEDEVSVATETISSPEPEPQSTLSAPEIIEPPVAVSPPVELKGLPSLNKPVNNPTSSGGGKLPGLNSKPGPVTLPKPGAGLPQFPGLPKLPPKPDSN